MTAGFRYLNREGRWDGWTRYGLEVTGEGEARLAGLPSLALRPLADARGSRSNLNRDREGAGFAGITEDGCGGLWYTAGDSLRYRDCAGEVSDVPVETGGAPLLAPAGLSYLPQRDAIVIADSGNNRVILLRRETQAVSEVIGSLNTPWHAAPDAEGALYVLDYGNRRVLKFGKTGALRAQFWSNMRDSGFITQPAGLAVDAATGTVWVLDLDWSRVFAFSTDGRPVKRVGSADPVSIDVAALANPFGLAVSGGAVFVGDNAARRIAVFRPGQEPEAAGEGAGYEGPIAALAAGAHGRLLVHPGAAATPAELVSGSAFAHTGLMWTGPITTAEPLTIWHTLRAIACQTGPSCEMRLFWAVAQAGPPHVYPDAPEPFPAGEWDSLPQGATEGFLDRYKGGPLYVGVLFTSDGSATPILYQLRADFNRDSWMPLLPEIYRRPVYATDPAQRDDFLLRYLSMFESFTDDAGRTIDALAALFDAAAAPPGALDWLAGLVDAYLEEDWSVERKRRAIAGAFERHAQRGTPAAIRSALRLDAGVEAVIEEPARAAGCWALPAPSEACDPETAGEWNGGEDSLLGFTTTLAAQEPQGSVLGTTATLDRSSLIRDEDFGAPLFEDSVHRFSVQLPGSASANPETMARIEAVLEREAPAHTAWSVQSGESRFLVGYSARVGVDTVLAALPSASPLGGDRVVLAGDAVMSLGKGAAIGRSTRI